MTTKRRIVANVNWIRSPDIAAAMAIEEASFDTPWTEQEFRRAVKDGIGLAAKLGDGTLVGFSVFSLSRHRVDVMNMAVSPAYRRRGVGRLLVAAMIKRLYVYEHRFLLTAHAYETNLPFQLFLQACGLRCVISRGVSRYVFHYRRCSWQ